MSFQIDDQVTLNERWEVDLGDDSLEDSWVGIPGKIVAVRTGWEVDKGMYPILIRIEVDDEPVTIPVNLDEIERIR